MQRKKQSKCSSYHCAQVFGSNETSQVQDEDIISSLKYDPTGNYLCLGDKAGRIIIFSNTNTTSDNTKPQGSETGDEQQRNFDRDNSKNNQINYDYFAEFQSHVREFDTFKSLEIEEEIVDISWLRPQGKYLKLITTNPKNIKFWKAFQKTEKKKIKSATKQLHFPKLEPKQTVFTAKQYLTFPSAHSTEINSISHSYNEQYLLSTDDQSSFLWNLQKPVLPYIANSITNRRKSTTSQLILTCSNMHPKSDSIFVYGMNRCELGVCDVRISGNKNKVVDFGIESRSMKNFFSDMIASVSSVQFMQNCKYIISRQYLNIKIWDITNPKKPIHNICIQQQLKSNLVNLFQNNNVYDKFSIRSSPDSSTILTGNYNNNFHLINFNAPKQKDKQNISPTEMSRNSAKNIKGKADSSYTNMQYELSFDKKTIMREITPGTKSTGISQSGGLKQKQVVKKFNAKQRVSVLDFHPFKHEIAVASLNCFFVYGI